MSGSSLRLAWEAVDPSNYPLHITVQLIEKHENGPSVTGYKANVTSTSDPLRRPLAFLDRSCALLRKCLRILAEEKVTTRLTLVHSGANRLVLRMERRALPGTMVPHGSLRGGS